MPKPYPIYTDGVNLYTSFDGGATLLPLGGETATNNVAAPLSGDGTIATPFTIASGAVALTKLATQANNTALINVSGGAASPVAGTATQLTALINPATSSLPGAMTAANAAAIVSGVPCAAYLSSVIDFTTVADNIAYFPANAGKFFFPIRFTFMFLAIAGTASGSSVFCVGNDAGHQNIITQAQGTSTSGSLNALTGGSAPPIAFGFNDAGTGGSMVDSNTPIVIKVVTAPTGITTLTGRIVVIGTWI